MRLLLIRRLGAACAAALLAAVQPAYGVTTAGAAAPSPAPSPGCTVRHYRVQALPLLPHALNERGEVAGVSARHRAALWSAAAGLVELDVPAGFELAEAVSLNDAGHAVVVAHDASLERHASFLYAEGRLAPLPGSQTDARHIGAADEIVGEAVVPGRSGAHPVRWRRGELIPLADCCGGSLTDANASGVAVGNLYDPQGHYAAFAWTFPTAFGPIGPAGQFSTAVAINAAGHVLIQGFPGAFLWSAGAAERLALAPHRPSHPRALNDCDVIVGDYGPSSDAARAFVWSRAGGFQDLNTLTGDADWTLEKAAALNDRGEIVGRGEYRHREGVGYLLTPE